jgi:hypothetical protein
MKIEEVPQDSENSTYGGGHKVIYAVDDQGDFVSVKSSGWTVEAGATQMALEQIRKQCDESWRRASHGETSALEYFMYYRRMDLALLSQTTGLFQWRIRRHFNPRVYQKLGARLMARYAQALEFDIQTLTQLPQQPLHD